ncbi:MAG: hypothetical protein K0R84_878 [Clostridia bacterium]|jgi:hypothetical protein|nr:hypothetical protein [Clostridia bacterium]
MAKKLNSETNVSDKKPLLERLGLIEPVTKSDDDADQLDFMDTDVAITSEVRIVNENNDTNDNQDRVEKNTVEKLPIKDVYRKSGLEAKETNTVYLIESFLKALPANLPSDVKRQSIINLISASHIDIILLLKDGNRRLEVLNKYFEDFSNNVSELISSNEKQIRKLNERIAYHNRIIEEKKKMKEDLKSEIEYEVQKISGIIEFIENKPKQ